MLMRIKQHLDSRYLLLLAISYTILVTIAFIIPSTKIPSVNVKTIIGLDKIIHAGIHFILVICWLVFIQKRNTVLTLNSFLIVIIACVLYGILIEVIQYILNTRGAEIEDIFANLFGTTIGIIAFSRMK